MKMNSKYLGKIYEGRWKVIDMIYRNDGRNQVYILENIYNHERIQVCPPVMAKVDKGETTLSNTYRNQYRHNKIGGKKHE